MITFLTCIENTNNEFYLIVTETSSYAKIHDLHIFRRKSAGLGNVAKKLIIQRVLFQCSFLLS